MNKKIVNVFLFLFSLYLFLGLVRFLIPSLSSQITVIYVICDFLLILLGLSYVSKKWNIFYVVLLVLFFIFSGITYFNNKSEFGLLTWLNGLREIIPVFTTVLFLRTLVQSELFDYFNHIFKKIIKVFLFVNIPVAYYQFSLYGASDSVVGTLSGSGLLTIMIFLMCYYLIWIRFQEGQSEKINFKSNLKLVPFFIPTLINETKITFVLLLVYFFFQISVSLNKLPQKLIFVLMALVLFFAYNKYQASRMNVSEIYSDEFLDAYIYGDDVENEISLEQSLVDAEKKKDLPRFEKIKFTFYLISQDPSTLLFGKGFGQFMGNKFVETSSFAEKNSWLVSGTKAYLVYLLLQGGILGTLLIVIFILTPLFFFVIKNFRSKSNKIKLALFLIVITMIIFLYDTSFRFPSIIIVFSYLTCLLNAPVRALKSI